MKARITLSLCSFVNGIFLIEEWKCVFAFIENKGQDLYACGRAWCTLELDDEMKCIEYEIMELRWIFFGCTIVYDR